MIKWSHETIERLTGAFLGLIDASKQMVTLADKIKAPPDMAALPNPVAFGAQYMQYG